jgi:hypothetical protein
MESQCRRKEAANCKKPGTKQKDLYIQCKLRDYDTNEFSLMNFSTREPPWICAVCREDFEYLCFYSHFGKKSAWVSMETNQIMI